jgi:RsiW-degrading membrane proteinase PrsW (M82 family)
MFSFLLGAIFLVAFLLWAALHIIVFGYHLAKWAYHIVIAAIVFVIGTIFALWIILSALFTQLIGEQNSGSCAGAAFLTEGAMPIRLTPTTTICSECSRKHA